MRPSMSEDGGYGHLGSSMAQQTTEGKAIHLLKEDGYDQITDVKPGQGGYTAMAVKDGKSMEVLIDPNTGAVTQLH